MSLASLKLPAPALDSFLDKHEALLSDLGYSSIQAIIQFSSRTSTMQGYASTV